MDILLISIRLREAGSTTSHGAQRTLRQPGVLVCQCPRVLGPEGPGTYDSAPIREARDPQLWLLRGPGAGKSWPWLEGADTT